MADPLCPTCHSRIGTASTTPTGRTQGAEGTDSDGHPVPRWTDDPILTPLGLNGPAYVAHERIRGVHLKELQQDRQQQEQELGIDPPTVFSDLEVESKPTRRHIIELRESTEKILNAVGLSLEDYFKLDPDGNEAAQNPELLLRGAADPQTEWIDVERGAPYVNSQGQVVTQFTLPDSSTQLSPTLPGSTKIRAVHLEDLRHPVVALVPALMLPRFDYSVYTARMDNKANFRDVAACEEAG